LPCESRDRQLPVRGGDRQEAAPARAVGPPRSITGDPTLDLRADGSAGSILALSSRIGGSNSASCAVTA
jgi:hypothetical protein